MGRGHIPLGYRIENGAAVVVPEEAEQVRKIYAGYLAGQSLIEAAGNAGLTMQHASVKRILQNAHYLGDEFYPAVINKETFEAAEAERRRRSDLLGRNTLKKTDPEERHVETRFTMRPEVRQIKDPYERAAYIYSLIESEE